MTWCDYCHQHTAPTQDMQHHVLTMSHLENEKKWRETIHTCGHTFSLHTPNVDGFKCMGEGCKCHPRFLHLR